MCALGNSSDLLLMTFNSKSAAESLESCLTHSLFITFDSKVLATALWISQRRRVQIPKGRPTRGTIHTTPVCVAETGVSYTSNPGLFVYSLKKSAIQYSFESKGER